MSKVLYYKISEELASKTLSTISSLLVWNELSTVKVQEVMREIMKLEAVVEAPTKVKKETLSNKDKNNDNKKSKGE